jgi:hypothetical protein
MEQFKVGQDKVPVDSLSTLQSCTTLTLKVTTKSGTESDRKIRKEVMA